MRYSTLILITFILFCSQSCDSNENSVCIPPDKPTFSLENLNPFSETHGEFIGPQYFNDKVTIYYFPFSETWGTCVNRFGSLNTLFIDYGGNESDLRIIGVGKDDDTNIEAIVENKILHYVKDNVENKVWDTWCPEDRDLFFLDRNGSFNSEINLTPGFPENDIRGIIDMLLEM